MLVLAGTDDTLSAEKEEGGGGNRGGGGERGKRDCCRTNRWGGGISEMRAGPETAPDAARLLAGSLLDERGGRGRGSSGCREGLAPDAGVD